MIPVLNLVVVIMCIYPVTMCVCVCVCDQLRKGAIGGYSRDSSVVTRPKKKGTLFQPPLDQPPTVSSYWADLKIRTRKAIGSLSSGSAGPAIGDHPREGHLHPLH